MSKQHQSTYGMQDKYGKARYTMSSMNQKDLQKAEKAIQTIESRILDNQVKVIKLKKESNETV